MEGGECRTIRHNLGHSGFIDKIHAWGIIGGTSSLCVDLGDVSALAKAL